MKLQFWFVFRRYSFLIMPHSGPNSSCLLVQIQLRPGLLGCAITADFVYYPHITKLDYWYIFLLSSTSGSHVWVLAWEASWNLEEKRELGGARKDGTKTLV